MILHGGKDIIAPIFEKLEIYCDFFNEFLHDGKKTRRCLVTTVHGNIRAILGSCAVYGSHGQIVYQ